MLEIEMVRPVSKTKPGDIVSRNCQVISNQITAEEAREAAIRNREELANKTLEDVIFPAIDDAAADGRMRIAIKATFYTTSNSIFKKLEDLGYSCLYDRNRDVIIIKWGEEED